jgi:hypothetical protein
LGSGGARSASSARDSARPGVVLGLTAGE